ncbi:Fructosamine kinase [Stieleria neptunia]|uniref:Fructosamine kinase n=1 Tax=Stieleria neptunia TaxID=2527979 RepID=A0A518HHY9_9BACT|nr:fructosamine kinase family protein [Stieleria neptunia]QDV40447.1 Fructosamine kinase [Stieleria neptunia]
MLSNSLPQLLDVPLEVVDQRPLGGGCISEASVVTIRCDDVKAWEKFSDHGPPEPPTRLVIKRNSADMVSNFRCESRGLQALADANVIRVPQVFAVDVVGDQAFLAMEFIPTDPSGPSPERFSDFGRQLARLHRATAGERFGWPEDNYLGSAKQPNGACDSWAEFVATRRIGFQIRWATDQGLADARLKSDCDRIIARMDDLLAGRGDECSLLHGDLWSGNYLFEDAGQPVLIDPAVYRGCREAEWGMIKWFGNCPGEFEQAYEDEWPMADGWRRRVAIYLLYHQLNHLNLFGSSYANACRQTAREVLR